MSAGSSVVVVAMKSARNPRAEATVVATVSDSTRPVRSEAAACSVPRTVAMTSRAIVEN